MRPTSLKNIIPDWYWLRQYQKRQRNRSEICQSMAVLYSISPGSPKALEWNDGFVAGMRLLSNQYKIQWYNVAQGWPSKASLETFDSLLIKSNWNWVVDQYFRENYSPLTCRKGIVISGVGKPPPLREMLFYDFLFYQTDWYRPKIDAHPNIHKAFGINSHIMKPGQAAIKWDVISIGAFKPYKRYEKLISKKGRKLAVGEFSHSSNPIVQKLRAAGVEVKNWVSPSQLRAYILASKTVYIPAAVFGGGERAVLEGRACGKPVEVEADNPKLLQLLKGKIPDQNDYAAGIHKML